MVLASPAANAVCRSRVLISPRVFCRHKSLSAAIERGRQSSGAPRNRAPRDSSFSNNNPFYDGEGRSRTSDRERLRENDRRPSRFEDDRRPARFQDNVREDRPARREKPERYNSNSDAITARPGDWKCGANGCGYHNFAKNKNCHACGASSDRAVGERTVDRRLPREDDRRGSSSPRERTWEERAPRREQKQELEMRPGDWTCQVNRCGFHNFSKNTECHACGAPKDSEGRESQGRDQTSRRESPREPREARRSEGREERSRFSEPKPYGQREPERRHAEPRPYRQREPERQRDEYRPENLPYTTAASEFLYGYSSVLAAIKAGRRKLYKLYVHKRGLENEGSGALLQRAKKAKIDVREVGDEYLPLMDKASSGRPHNGFILEASPLPQPPITMLGAATPGGISVTLDQQSREDAMVNGVQTQYKSKASGWDRYPLVLYVDGVLDEGNLGAIARSAYFLGVDAIATPTRQSAPWSHIAVKASAGAAEALPIFRVSKPADFLAQSAREGWRVYASDAIPPEAADLTTSSVDLAEKAAPDISSAIVFSQARQAKRLPSDHSPLSANPAILIMGAEGTGLRGTLLNHAHFKVGIRAGRGVDEIGVDSLNVSVAASLLCFEFLKKPQVPEKKVSPEESLF